MKKKIFAMAAIAAAFLMVSCDKDQSFDENQSFNEEDRAIFGAAAQAAPLPGDFSVADGKQVRFAKANLRCDLWRGTTEWLLSDQQYSYNTSGNYNTGVMTFFTWGYDEYNSDDPGGTYNSNVNIEPGNNLSPEQDWGCNFGEKGTWRTLTRDEWDYLLKGRKYAAQKCGYATVNGAPGIIVLPDVFTDPMKNGGSGAFVPQSSATGWNANVYKVGGNWEAMEAAGALFLPAAGCRSGKSLSLTNNNGRYWSSTKGVGGPYALLFNTSEIYTSTAMTISGFSVRLVTNSYTVNFDLNGKDAKASVDHIKATHATTIAKPSDPFIIGYDLVGWYKDQACTKEWNFDTDVVTENITLYAKWAESKYGIIRSPFSVAGGKQVYFSMGNLTATIDANGVPTDWKFAAKQYDCLGKGGANETIGKKAGDVDLFGWSTAKTTYGISTSIKSEDYSGDFIDWGNAIEDKFAWRTLTTDEWQYLFNTRHMEYGKDRYTLNINFNGMVGVVLYPDNYDGPTLSADGKYTDKTFPEDCVFLPAAGYRFVSSVVNVGVLSYYWSSSVHENKFAFVVSSNSGVLNSDDDDAYRYGYAVRLVMDVTE